MAGILLSSGQSQVITWMASGIVANGGLYVGLMTNSSTPSEGAQIGAGITELDPSPAGSGYSRQLDSTWYPSVGTDPTISGDPVTFIVSGSWADVNGYFVSLSASGTDALWAECFSIDIQGTKTTGDRVIITPIYEQKYDPEA